MGFQYWKPAAFCLKLIPHVYLSPGMEACVLLQSFKAVLCQHCPFSFFPEMYKVSSFSVTGWNLWMNRFFWNGGLLIASALSFHLLWPEELYLQICLALCLAFLSTHSFPSRKSQMYSWAFTVYFRALKLAKTVLFYITDCLNPLLCYTCIISFNLRGNLLRCKEIQMTWTRYYKPENQPLNLVTPTLGSYSQPLGLCFSWNCLSITTIT